MTFDSFNDEDHLYFMTSTICGWKQLFSFEKYTMVIIDSFAWLQAQKRMLIFAYVVMPNHVHAILKPVNITIGMLLHDFGSFTAHKIVQQLKADKQTKLLEFFNLEKRDNRSNFSIWQDIQAKNIYSVQFLFQKMEYIHNNPAVEKWALVEDRTEYRFSSAGYYDLNETGLIRVDDIRKYLDA